MIILWKTALHTCNWLFSIREEQNLLPCTYCIRITLLYKNAWKIPNHSINPNPTPTNQRSGPWQSPCFSFSVHLLRQTHCLQKACDKSVTIIISMLYPVHNNLCALSITVFICHYWFETSMHCISDVCYTVRVCHSWWHVKCCRSNRRMSAAA